MKCLVSVQISNPHSHSPQHLGQDPKKVHVCECKIVLTRKVEEVDVKNAKGNFLAFLHLFKLVASVLGYFYIIFKSASSLPL